MKKTTPQYSLWLIIPFLLILPPIGLFMLWRSSRTLKVKIAATVVLVLLLAGATAGAVTTGLYAKLVGTEIPASGYDISMDGRGNYRNPKVLPFEREVFNAIVVEMRKSPASHNWSPGEVMTLEVVEPEAQSFDIVADEYGLDYEDVQGIYLKVSSKLVNKKK